MNGARRPDSFSSISTLDITSSTSVSGLHTPFDVPKPVRFDSWADHLEFRCMPARQFSGGVASEFRHNRAAQRVQRWVIGEDLLKAAKVADRLLFAACLMRGQC